jgi:hypothetical protein
MHRRIIPAFIILCAAILVLWSLGDAAQSFFKGG